MTIPSTPARIAYQGPSGTGPYEIPFRVLDPADLRVVRRDAAGLERPLVRGTDYSVEGADGSRASVTLTAPLGGGESLTIRRAPAYAQPTDLWVHGAFHHVAMEEALDRLAMQIQALADDVRRAPRLGESVAGAAAAMGHPTSPGQAVVVNRDLDGFALATIDTAGVALPGGGRTVASLSGYRANNAVFNVRDYGARGDGAADDRAAVVATAAAAAAAGGAAVHFPPGAYRIGSALTLSAPLVMMPGARLVPAAGVTLTINGAFDAGMHQVFELSAGGKIEFGVLGAGAPADRSIDYVRPEWWGAVADGSTPSTAAMNAAINQGRRVRLGVGTYVANCVHTWGYLVLDGAGCDATFIRSATPTGYAFVEKFAGSGWRRHATLNDLCLLGDGALRNGFCFGEPGGYTAGAELYGRCEFNRVQFQSCRIGVRKPYGNIGNVYNDCSWRGTQDHCYHAVGRGANAWGRGSRPMQTGAEIFNGGHMGEASLAAIYVDDGPTAGQNVYNGLVIEGCAGFGVFVRGYPNEGAGAMAFNDCWIEGNAKAGSVTIDGERHAPRDLYFRDAKHVVISRSKLTGSLQLVRSHVVEHGCTYYQNAVTADALSTRLVYDQYSNRALHAAGTVMSYAGLSTQFGGAGDIFRVLPRATRTYGYTPAWSESYGGPGPWAFTGTAGASAASVPDGVLFQTCAELTVPNGSTVFPSAGAFRFANGKWYVYSIDVKLVSARPPTTLAADGDATFFPNAAARLVQGKWVTIGGVAQSDKSNSAYLPYIVNDTGGAVRLRLSAAQVVQFDTMQEAIDYFNARLYR